MNKRIKKKRELETKVEAFGQYMQVVHHTIERFGDCLEEIVQTTSLKQEVIEDYGRQLGEVKRELADLRAIVERNAQSSNNRFDQLEAENKGLRIIIRELKRQLTAKKPFWKR